MKKKDEVVGQFIGLLVVAPILMTLLWNYGATDVIESLGGPDANVSLVNGWLGYLFMQGVATSFGRAKNL